MPSTFQADGSYAYIYGSVLPDDSRLLDFQAGEEISVFASNRLPAVTHFKQKCLRCPAQWIEEAVLPNPGLSRVEAINERRRSLALICEIHMATSHGGDTLGDDPRLADVASQDLPPSSGARKTPPQPPKPRKSVSGQLVCEVCGEEDPPHAGCILAEVLNEKAGV